MTAAEWWIQHRVIGGGLWAVRETRFDWDATRDGASLVVTGADLLDVCRAIAEQESIADLASS